eukprot:GHVU01144001.1.p1 GENE.GHVU01144001.1~~GHVU01144001.1.p1  ORF type:complete len:502 (+),score=57.27 GHVU01144001.1:719-2224(+)
MGEPRNSRVRLSLPHIQSCDAAPLEDVFESVAKLKLPSAKWEAEWEQNPVGVVTKVWECTALHILSEVKAGKKVTVPGLATFEFSGAGTGSGGQIEAIFDPEFLQSCRIRQQQQQGGLRHPLLLLDTSAVARRANCDHRVVSDVLQVLVAHLADRIAAERNHAAAVEAGAVAGIGAKGGAHTRVRCELRFPFGWLGDIVFSVVGQTLSFATNDSVLDSGSVPTSSTVAVPDSSRSVGGSRRQGAQPEQGEGGPRGRRGNTAVKNLFGGANANKTGARRKHNDPAAAAVGGARPSSSSTHAADGRSGFPTPRRVQISSTVSSKAKGGGSGENIDSSGSAETPIDSVPTAATTVAIDAALEDGLECPAPAAEGEDYGSPRKRGLTFFQRKLMDLKGKLSPRNTRHTKQENQYTSCKSGDDAPFPPPAADSGRDAAAAAATPVAGDYGYDVAFVEGDPCFSRRDPNTIVFGKHVIKRIPGVYIPPLTDSFHRTLAAPLNYDSSR